MDRAKVLNFCIAGLILYGMAELSFGGSGDDDLVCLWEQDIACDDVTETTCTHTCQKKVIFGGGAVQWACRKEDGNWDVTEYKTEKNSFRTTVESDLGFCFPGAEQSPVYCATVYTCSGSCNKNLVGELCDDESYHGTAGRGVRPKVVDQRMICPYDCWWLLDDVDVDPIDGPP